MTDNPDWRGNLKVTHPTFNESRSHRERRVLQMLTAFMDENADEMDEAFVAKIGKAINVRMLDILNEARDA